MSADITVPLSLAVEVSKMLEEHGVKDRFVSFSRDKGNVTIPNDRSDAFRRVLTQYNIPDSVSVEQLTSFIERLISNDQASQFDTDASAVLIVPEVTYTALKEFIEANNITSPLARSIVGPRPVACPDYRCPHSLAPRL